MRLSDAAIMGSTITKMCLGSWYGCFLAAAAKAVGIRDFNADMETGSRMARDIRKYWPWLSGIAQEDHPYRDYLGHIIRSYDDEVMNFEQLVDYVKSVEPDCGDCNERVCTCVGLRIQEVPAAVQKPLVLVDPWAHENVE